MSEPTKTPTVAVFECVQCARVDRILIRDLTVERLRITAADHCHFGSGVSPANMREDIEDIVRFFDPGNISIIEPALRRRGLRLHLE